MNTRPYHETARLILPSSGRGRISLEGDRLPVGTYRLLANVPDGWRDHLEVTGSAVHGRHVVLKETSVSPGVTCLDMELKPMPFSIILR